jgi:polysaccharide biosynthesis protein PslJ
MQTIDRTQIWFSRLDRRVYALLVGAAIGLLGGVIGLMMVLLGPVITFGLVLGAVGAIYILTDVYVALYAVVAVMMLLPFGTFPFKIGFTPTLLDAVIGVFVLVYLMQWMTGKHQTLHLAPPHSLIAIYMLWLMLSFALGLRHAPMTMNVIRQFAGTLLSIGLVFVIVDLLHDPVILRRFVLVVLVLIATQAMITIGLYILPDLAAENLLNKLGRIGYPVGGVIRYIESNPALPERAIGTWIDPNSLGGVLAISAVLIAPQAFANKPVLRYRWLTFAVLLLVTLALILSNSRASMLAMVAGLGVIAFFRYRRFIPVLLLAAVLMMFLPQTQYYMGRFVEAFTAKDLATQMRIGEWTDSLILINRYPIFGVGFTGAPDIDIYTDVANMYLIMANQIGLVGLTIYLIAIGGVFLYGVSTWRFARHDVELDSIHLGFHAALLTALVNAVADLYFFRLDFQASITLFWLVVALSIASSRLVFVRSKKSESTLVKETKIM